MKTTKEFYQVVTKDRKSYFREHETIDTAIEQITYLLNDGGLPNSNYEYEILHIIETRSEEVIQYPVSL